jgi:hypothetical protein
MRISLVALLLAVLAVNACAEMVIIEGDGFEFDVIEIDQSKTIARKTEDYLDKRVPKINGTIQLENPPTTATEESVRRVDVTYTYPYDVADKAGNTLRRKGDTFNPLTKVTIPELIVVSGKNEMQLIWAQNYKDENLAPTSMIVLIDGNWVDARNKGVEAYRLSDRLQQRLHITHVPCLVTQDGSEVLIHEFSAKDIK